MKTEIKIKENDKLEMLEVSEVQFGWEITLYMKEQDNEPKEIAEMIEQDEMGDIIVHLDENGNFQEWWIENSCEELDEYIKEELKDLDFTKLFDFVAVQEMLAVA